MVSEVLKFLQPGPGGNYIDGTVGGGGHTEAILEQSAPDGRVLGIDADIQALAKVRERLSRWVSDTRTTLADSPRYGTSAASRVSAPRCGGGGSTSSQTNCVIGCASKADGNTRGTRLRSLLRVSFTGTKCCGVSPRPFNRGAMSPA